MKFSGVTATMAIACATTLPTPSATSTRRMREVRSERDSGDDGEPHPLVREVALLAAERPVPVPPVVVRHGDEKREERRAEVVQIRPLEQRRVDGEVDGVAARPDRAEPRELKPVVRRAQRADRARGDRVHYAASFEITSSTVPSAFSQASSSAGTRSRSHRARLR